MSFIKKTLGYLLDREVWRSRTGVLAAGMFATMMWFVVDWCTDTTFRAMSDWLLYVINAGAALVLLFPFMATRKVWCQLVLMLLVDLLLMANLMYCRTYLSAIPLQSYTLASNLGDFTASVWDSLRWRDIGFAVILLATAFFAYRIPRRFARRTLGVWGSWIGIGACITFVTIQCRGGFYNEYDRLIQSCYYSTCGVPTYTVAGSIIYNVIDNRLAEQTDPAEYVNPWLDDHARLMPHTTLPDSVTRRRNLVLLSCESLESWVINKEINGKRITPYLDSLLTLPGTFYAPNVLTQVGSGRSSDARLIMHTGLLPMLSAVYSMKYPSVDYPTINKALRETYGSDSYLFTCDKPITWNIEAVSRSFGYNKIFDRRSWQLDELIGNPAKLSDGSFLRQSVAKLQADSTIWPVGEPRMLTFITYSGHSPFVLPDKFKDPDFDIRSSQLPERMQDYITMAHYTDSQLHTLIDYIQSRPDYDDTMIMIVGDHEGLAGLRNDFLKSDKARKIMSAGQYTPFILLNSPVEGRYDATMGQVDIYPTLLNLLGADNYFWKGLGQSIFAPNKPEVAISTMTYEIAGDTTALQPGVMDHLRKARRVSDAIIRADLLKQKK